MCSHLKALGGLASCQGNFLLGLPRQRGAGPAFRKGGSLQPHLHPLGPVLGHLTALGWGGSGQPKEPDVLKIAPTQQYVFL